MDASEHLRRLAARVVEEALSRVELRAALLVGSSARGDADFYSDLDLLLYVEAVPPRDVLAEIRQAVGGTNPVAKEEPSEHFLGDEFDLEGVRTEVSFVTVGRTEWQLERLLEGLEAVDSPRQKILVGLLEGLPLHGGDVVERWQARLRNYPEPLRRATIERHWRFFPLWYYGEAMAARDAELWRLDVLLDAVFDLLAVLAGLNRLYFARFELKRMRGLIAKMKLAPPQLADRVESLFRLEPEAASTELGRLVEETRALVLAELPDLGLPIERPPGTRQQPWA
jgi:predicted nucleotidyltransferase